VTNEERVRAALEKAFGEPFTEYQWSMITSLGYERTVLAKERTVEQVAEELRQLQAVVAARPDVAKKALEPDATIEAPVTWDQMERLVLGRVLAIKGAEGTRPAAVSGGAPERRYRGSQKRTRRRRQILTGVCLVLAAAVVAVALVNPWRETSTTAAPESPGAPASTPASASGGGWPAEAVFSHLTTTTSSTTTSSTTTTLAQTPDFVAHLSGAESTPPMDTLATGVLSLTLTPGGDALQYVFAVTNALDLTMAALCQGEPGVSGARIFTLRDDRPIPGVFSGVAVRGTLTADMLFGPLAGKTMADLVVLLEEGMIYVKAGTAANPWGEIRGQVGAVE